jgi:hemoglobin-like flavoprotein
MEISAPLPSLISRLYQDNNNLGTSLNTAATPDSDTVLSESVQSASRELSLSIRSQKLSAISKEFFNGPIASKNMAALSQSLYENGFISNSELQAIDNTKTEQSTITQSKHFINSFMFEASKQGDSQTLSMLEPIAQAIDNMDAVGSNRQRQTEVTALDNANQILEHLKTLKSDEALITEFENVVDVLSTLDTVRQNDQTKQGIAEYESMQNEYESLFNPAEDS